MEKQQHWTAPPSQSARPSLAAVQKSLPYPRVRGSEGAMLLSQATLHGKIPRNVRSTVPFPRARDTWWDGSTPRRGMEPQASSASPGTGSTGQQ